MVGIQTHYRAKFIMVSMYNILLFGIIGYAVISLLGEDRVSSKYIVLSMAVGICTPVLPPYITTYH